MRTKKNADGKVLSYFNRGKKIFNETSAVDHIVFLNVNEEQKITEKTPIGTRVLVAKYPDFYTFYLYKYHNTGEDFYPLGGVQVWNLTDQQMQSFYVDSVAIHPDTKIYKFKGVKEIDVDNI